MSTLDELLVYDLPDLVETDDEPTEAQWNEWLFTQPQAAQEDRWQLARGCMEPVVWSWDSVGKKIDVTDCNAIIHGHRFDDTGNISMVGAATGHYYFQLADTGVLWANLATEDTDMLLLGEGDYDSVTEEVTNLTLSAMATSGGISFDGVSSAGDVVGPGSATANALAQYDGTTGKLLKNGPALVTEIGAAPTDAQIPTAQAVDEALDLKVSTTGAEVYGVGGGTANAQAATYTPTVTVLTVGMELWWIATAANTGACTFAPDTITAAPIKKHFNQALAANDIKIGQAVGVKWDGTNWQMLSHLGNTPAGTGDMTKAEYGSPQTGVVNEAVSAQTLEGLAPSDFATDDHTHDDRYFTESEMAATTDNAAGADLVGATEIDGYVGATVQALLEAIVTALAAKEDGLGNPPGLNRTITSTVAGVRSWATLTSLGALLVGDVLNDPAMGGGSPSSVYPSTEAAVKAYADGLVAAANALTFQDVIDCSTNPNYPAAVTGNLWIASVAGKIGGASGKSVEVGDFIICVTDNAGGTEAEVGTSWTVVQTNLTGAVIGPASSIAGSLPVFSGVSGQVLEQGPSIVTTVGDPGSDDNVPTEQAVREAIPATTDDLAEGVTNLYYSEALVDARINAAARAVSQAFTAQTSVVVTHNFGAYPLVQIIDGSGAQLIPESVTHSSVNAFTVAFSASTTGTILATLGAPTAKPWVLLHRPIADDDSLIAGNGVGTIVIPDEWAGLSPSDANAHVFTVSSSGAVEIRLYSIRTAATITTVNITIDATEKDSATAATPATVDGTFVFQAGDEIRIDVIGDGTGAAGLEIRLTAA